MSSNPPSDIPPGPSSHPSHGGTGLSHSNPIRTISSPTGLHGKGLAVASRTQTGVGLPPPPNTKIKSGHSVISSSPPASSTLLQPPSSTAQTPVTSNVSMQTTNTQNLSDPLKNPPPATPATKLNENVSSSSKLTLNPSSVFRAKSQNSDSSSNSQKFSRLKTTPQISKKISSSIAKTLSSSNSSHDPREKVSRQRRLVSSNASSSTIMTLDEETDLFLSPQPLAPPPLKSSNDPVTTIQNLISRRAWGDVMHFTGEYLSSPSYPYHPFYSQLRNASSVTSASANLLEILRNMREQKHDSNLSRLQKETCYLIAFRFHAMLKLRRFSDLGREVEVLNLLSCRFLFPDEYEDDHVLEKEEKYDDLTGSFLPLWVSYGLKILAAQSLQYTDNPQGCLDMLHNMKHELDERSSSSSPSSRILTKQWGPRVNIALANAFMRVQEWRMTLDVLDDILESLPSTVKFSAGDIIRRFILEDSGDQGDQALDEITLLSTERTDCAEAQYLSSILLPALRIEILSRQLRVFLQIGASSIAYSLQDAILVDFQSFNEKMSTRDESIDDEVYQHIQLFLKGCPLIQQTHTQVLLNQGLLSFANLDYKSAKNTFAEAISIQRLLEQEPTTGDDSSTGNLSSSWNVSFLNQHFLNTGVLESLDADQHQLAHALNNLALCALYTCDVNSAVDLMESLVKENPTLFLTEVMVFNLCTLYELGADVTGSGKKKKILQSVAKRFFLHDIGVENFRIG